MYKIKDGIRSRDILPFLNLYWNCVSELMQKTKTVNMPDKIITELHMIKEIIDYRFWQSSNHFHLLYKDTDLIGFQCLYITPDDIKIKQATIWSLYIKPEYRKIITINDKTTYAVAHLRDYAYAIIDKTEVEAVHVCAHSLLVKNILMYIREGFVPYRTNKNGFINMIKDNHYILPREEIDKLMREVINTETVPLVDINNKKFNFNFKKKDTKDGPVLVKSIK